MCRGDESFHLLGRAQQYGPTKRKTRCPPNFPPGMHWIDIDEGRSPASEMYTKLSTIPRHAGMTREGDFSHKEKINFGQIEISRNITQTGKKMVVNIVNTCASSFCGWPAGWLVTNTAWLYWPELT